MVTGPLPAHAAELVTAIRSTDRAVLAAAGSGSAELATEAFARHPMVGSRELAQRLLAGYAAAHPQLAQFR
jgi:6-phospho-beta-glucosidase